MDGSISTLSELLKKTNNPPSIFFGQVVSVGDDVCSVKIGDIEYADVKLRITDESLSDKLVLKPKVDSNVLVADLSGDKRALAILQVETVDELLLTKGTIGFKITDAGFCIEKDGFNLNTILSDFFDEVMKIIVVQGTSPNVPALTALKTQLNQILC